MSSRGGVPLNRLSLPISVFLRLHLPLCLPLFVLFFLFILFDSFCCPSSLYPSLFLSLHLLSFIYLSHSVYRSQSTKHILSFCLPMSYQGTLNPPSSFPYHMKLEGLPHCCWEGARPSDGFATSQCIVPLEHPPYPERLRLIPCHERLVKVRLNLNREMVPSDPQIHSATSALRLLLSLLRVS